MKLQLFITLILILLMVSTYSQDKDVQSLFNQASKSMKLFVVKKPLNNSRIDSSDSTFYTEYLLHSSGQTVDSKTFIEIINNSQHADTSDWKDEELQGSILIKDSIELVDKNYVMKKFGTPPKTLPKLYRNALRQFNKHIPDRRYYKMSRPVFDNAHHYAVVNISNNYYGGMLLMFKKESNVWKELGMIDVWRW